MAKSKKSKDDTMHHATDWMDMYKFLMGRMSYASRLMRKILDPQAAQVTQTLEDAEQALAAAGDAEAEATAKAWVRAAAAALADLKRLQKAAGQVIAAAKKATEQQLLLGTPTRAIYGKSAVELDRKVDHAVKEIHHTLVQRVHALGLTHPVGAKAEALRASLFPRGVKPIIDEPFVQETLLVDRLLKLLDDRATDVTAIKGLDFWVEQTRTLNQAYDASLKTEAAIATRASVRKEEDAANRRFNELVMAVFTIHPGDEQTAIDQRAPLLAPIIFQTEQMRLKHKQGGKVKDVDPNTGEELEDEAEEAETAVEKDEKKEPNEKKE